MARKLGISKIGSSTGYVVSAKQLHRLSSLLQLGMVQEGLLQFKDKHQLTALGKATRILSIVEAFTTPTSFSTPSSQDAIKEDVTNCHNSLPYHKTLGKHLPRQCRHECIRFMTCALVIDVLG
jgi:hypothetical protein